MSQRRLGYALSNGIRAVISRPRFSDAAFAVGEEDAHVTLRIKYTETTIGISSRSGDRSGRVARPAADPSQATGRVKRRDTREPAIACARHGIAAFGAAYLVQIAAKRSWLATL